jgi:hypothetical protein
MEDKKAHIGDPMEDSFEPYNLGITWIEFGDQDRPGLDRLLDSRAR